MGYGINVSCKCQDKELMLGCGFSFPMVYQETMEDIKELFKELAEELEKDCSGWDIAQETEADKTFKEKMITLVKEKYREE